jgi:hypothetical protein
MPLDREEVKHPFDKDEIATVEPAKFSECLGIAKDGGASLIIGMIVVDLPLDRSGLKSEGVSQNGGEREEYMVPLKIRQKRRPTFKENRIKGLTTEPFEAKGTHLSGRDASGVEVLFHVSLGRGERRQEFRSCCPATHRA